MNKFCYRNTLTQMADALLSTGSTSEALFQLQRLVAYCPNDADTYHRMGDGYFQADMIDKARESYANALTHDPTHVSASIGLVKCGLKEGDVENAEKELLRLKNEFPHHVDAYILLAQIELSRKNLEGCLSLYANAAQVAPDNFDVHAILGRLLLSIDDVEGAEKVFQHARSISPNDAFVVNMLAVISYRQDRILDALSYLRLALTLGPLTVEHAKSFATIVSRAFGNGAGIGALEQFQEMYNHPSVDEILSRLKTQMSSQEGKICHIPANRSSKLVVFVGDWPRTRHAKLSYALRKAGWETVLLCKNTLGNDLKEYFDEVRYYRDDWQAVALASTFAPQVYHVFSSWSESTNVAMIKNKPGKVIFDCYDVVEGIDGGEKYTQSQKFCIENADGLCCRDLRFQYLRRHLNYRFPEKLIFFPEYCWDFQGEPNQSRKQNWHSDGDIHAVSVGAFDVEKLGHQDSGYLDIVEHFINHKVHLHIYPSPMQLVCNRTYDDIFSDYLAIQQQTPYFHIYQPVPQKEVLPELANYHLAVHIVKPILNGGSLRRYAPFQIHYGGPARMWDYLDAGLPVLAHKAFVHNFSMFSRFGMMMDVTPSVLAELRPRIIRLLSENPLSQMNKARSKYAVRNQIGRLIAFYNSI